MARRLVLGLLLAGAVPAVADEPWQKREVLGYSVHFTAADAAEIDAVAKVLRDFDRAFAEATGAEARLFAGIRIDVYLYPPASPEVGVGYISLEGGPRQQGEQLGYVGKIKMPGPKAYDGTQLSSSGHPMDRNAFDKFLVHEVAPAYLELFARSRGARFSDSVPDWFEQGLEEYFAVFHSTPYWRTTGLQAYHRRAQQAPTIDTDFGLNLRDPYNDGLLILNFLRDEFGEQAIVGILGSSEPTFGRRLRTSVDVPFDEFLRRFDRWRSTRLGKS